jgi:hypothetical protein
MLPFIINTNKLLWLDVTCRYLASCFKTKILQDVEMYGVLINGFSDDFVMNDILMNSFSDD